MSYADHEWVSTGSQSDIAWCRRCGIPIEDHDQECPPTGSYPSVTAHDHDDERDDR